MKNSMMLLITLYLAVSCSSFPIVEPIEVCAINVKENIKQSYCRCAEYDFNYGQLKAISESYNKPIDFCNKHIGMAGQGWIDLIHYIDSIYVWKDKHKNFKSDKSDVDRIPLREVFWYQTPLNLLYEEE